MSYDAQLFSSDVDTPLAPSVPLTSSWMVPSSPTSSSVGVSYVGQTYNIDGINGGTNLTNVCPHQPSQR